MEKEKRARRERLKCAMWPRDVKARRRLGAGFALRSGDLRSGELRRVVSVSGALRTSGEACVCTSAQWHNSDILRNYNTM